jgi:L-fuculose-phosphate aldolase
MSDERAVREGIVRACRDMLDARLTRGTSGNISVCVPGGMLITPSAVPYASLTPEMLVHVSLDADAPRVGSRPSTEWRMHAAILRSRPEVGAVLHAHPPFATALACVRRAIPAFHYMVATAGGNDIRCAEYATFGTAELAAHVLGALRDRTACLLANHGMVALGTSVERALELAIEVEALAEAYCTALQVGEPVLLGDEEMARVHAAFVGYRIGD